MSTEFNALRPVDQLEVLVLVDNVMDIFSTAPGYVSGQIPNVVAAGAKELGGHCLCCGAWGLSLVITTETDGVRRNLLFDTGPESYALERNAARLGFDFGSIDCAVASHGHFDHMGGLLKALELVVAANGGRQVPVHVNPGMFPKRGIRNSETCSVLPLEEVPGPEDLAAAGGDVVNSPDSRLVLDETVLVSGEIPRVTEYEPGLPSQVRLDGNGDWVPDPLLMDERYVAVNLGGHGIVVFSACSHAGIVNVLTDARDRASPVPLYGVMGGLHLSGPAHEPLIEDTVRDLSQFQLQRLVVGHCTGWRAFEALVNEFGDNAVLEAVGHSYRFG